MSTYTIQRIHKTTQDHILKDSNTVTAMKTSNVSLHEIFCIVCLSLAVTRAEALYNIKFVYVVENIVAFSIMALPCSFNKLTEMFCQSVTAPGEE